MDSLATLSTSINSNIKRALSAYCKSRGLKLRFVIEQAIIGQIEDDIDLEAFHMRKGEERLSLEEVLGDIG